MSRSGYTDDGDQWGLIRWRGAVKAALRGRRGQAFLRELRDALDAMPEKKLITGELERDGCYCTLGAIGASRGLDLEAIDPVEYDTVARTFKQSEALVREIEYMNDEGGWTYDESPEQRWTRMRRWVNEQINEEPEQ